MLFRSEYENGLEHSTRHPEPEKDCIHCQFPRKRHQLEKECGWVDPKCGKEYSWVIESLGANTKKEPYGLGCYLCRWAGYKNQWGRCSKMNFRNMRRHSNDTKHKQALQRFLGGMEKDGETLEAGGQPLDHGVGYAHVLKLLETLEQNKSLRSFVSSMKNLASTVGDVNPDNDSRRVARQVMTLCAGHELHVTRQLLEIARRCDLVRFATGCPGCIFVDLLPRGVMEVAPVS